MNELEQITCCLGRNVQALRRERGLSQERLAHDAGLDRTYVGGIERGKRNPSIGVVAQLAAALGTSVVALLSSPSPQVNSSTDE